ncbi:MAG: efflux RND transporter periplasmic adaptor subunit [Lachnospiraceae bacterium]|nr:efflux RND transporter periplasmic adaptor subunit [Lachnospiraceae bacterium]
MKNLLKVICVLMCVSVTLTACSGNKSSDEETAKATYVETMVAKKADISKEYTYSGKVKPQKTLNIIPSVSGKVAKVNFEVGDSVKENDVLFEIDTIDIENNLDVLKASLASAEAGVESAKTAVEFALGSSVQSAIASAKAALTNAELAYNNAKKDYENSKILFDEDILSKDTLEKAEMAFKSAEASYNQALTGYDIAINQVPKESVQKTNDALASATASRDAVLAQIKSAEKTLNDAKVTTPIKGIVSAVNVTEGGMASQTVASFIIIDIEKVTINVSVSESIVGKLEKGNEASLEIPTYKNESISGKIKTISPATNETGTYSVEIELDNKDGKIKSDMFAKVYFIDEHSENVIVLPRSLVLSDGEASYVFTVENNIVKKAIVSTGIDNGDEIEITDGITEGTVVVSKGQAYLEDGDEIVIASSQKEE